MKETTQLTKEITDILHKNTGMRFKNDIRQFINFYQMICNKLNINVSDYKDKKIVLNNDDYLKFVTTENGIVLDKYHKWLKHICNHIFKCPYHNFPKKIKPIERIIKPEEKLHFVKINELEELWRAGNDEERMLMLLLLTTGMRANAVEQINKNKIDFENKKVTVIEKNGKTKTYYLTDQVIEYIKNTKYFNKNKTSETLRARIKNMCKKSNIKNYDHIHPHSFRHTCAKLLINNGVDIKTVQILLGHENVELTKNIYVQSISKDVIENDEVPWLNIKNKEKKLPDFLIMDER
jgi:integrase